VPIPSKLNIGAAGCDRSNARGPNVRLAGGSVRQACQVREAHRSIGMSHQTRLAPRPAAAGSGTGLVTTLLD
jgi:hypothetical protein